MLICPHCNNIVTEEEACTTDKTYDYEGGCRVVVSSFSHYGCCENCGHELEKATLCKVCGEYYYEENEFPPMEYGVCEECFEEALSIQTALNLGSTNSEKISINGFALFLLGEDKINSILVEYIKNMQLNDKGKEVANFFSQDKSYLADFIEAEQRE